MILTKKVLVKVSKTYKFYESKGYQIPKNFEERTKKLVVRHGT